jgi:hypothetical protein
MNEIELKKMLELHSLWLKNEEGGVRANLRVANLRRANLGGANLEGADLRRANLRVANLRRANLEGANLGGADLWGADLRGANLRGADLEGADLRGADLRGANLVDANLVDANLRGANLTNTKSDFKIFKSISGLEYPITIKDNVIQAGCQTHTYEEWKGFDSGTISKMSEDALTFYPILMTILTKEFN